MSLINSITSSEITFEDACAQYSTDSTNKANVGEIGLVSDLSSCTADSSIVTILPQLTKKGMYSIPVALSTGKYAVLEVTEIDTTVLKDDILSQLNNANEVIYSAEAFLLNEANFTFKDKYFESQMKSKYPEYFK